MKKILLSLSIVLLLAASASAEIQKCRIIGQFLNYPAQTKTEAFYATAEQAQALADSWTGASQGYYKIFYYPLCKNTLNCITGVHTWVAGDLSVIDSEGESVPIVYCSKCRIMKIQQQKGGE